MTTPTSPLVAAEGPVHVTLLADGQPVPGSVGLISVSIGKALNALPWARLCLADGDMARGEWVHSEGSCFVPGVPVVIKLGYGDGEEEVFRGIVARQSLRISGDNNSRLVGECHDPAARLMATRQSAVYLGQSDGELMSAIVTQAGLDAGRFEASTERHRQLVRRDCTDWDFLLARAQAQGLLLTVDAGRVSATRPPEPGAARLRVAYGESMLEFEAERQAAEPPQPGAPGNRHRVRARTRFQGSALAQVGTLLELGGVGMRFNGQVCITRLCHEVADGQWTTAVEFASPAGSLTACLGADAPAPGGLLPGIAGLHVGQVVRLNADPQPPVVLGSLYSSRHAPPHERAADNDIQALITRSQCTLAFNDQDKSLTLQDLSGNTVVLSEAGIRLDSPGDIVLSAQGRITLSAAGEVAVCSKADVTLTGQNVGCTAQVGFAARGAATAELSASGQTTVKGALVMIN